VLKQAGASSSGRRRSVGRAPGSFSSFAPRDGRPSNGREAVDAFRGAHDGGRNYDLICMDIMMPEMDGQAALKQIRALEEAAGVCRTPE
jgi:hypothetical protein